MELRVYREEAAEADRLTMRAAFDRHLRPSITGRRAAATIAEYELALVKWEAFCAARLSTLNTGAPPEVVFSPPTDHVPAIRDNHLEAFRDWCQRPKSEGGLGLTAATTNKTWHFLRPILRRLGPREAGNPRALGMIEWVPSMEPAEPTAEELEEADDGDVWTLSPDELAALHDACGVATWPAESPVIQWQTFIVIGSCLGPRVEDHARLRWADFHLDRRSPVKRSRRVHEPGYLAWLPEKTKRKKRARLIVPMPPCCRLHLDALPTGTRQGIYTWPSSRRHAWRAQWHAITAQAGLEGFQATWLRATCNTQWESLKEGLGHWVLGHAARDVNDRHYVAAEPSLIKHAPLLEVPDCFNRRLGSRQRFLF